VASSGSSAPLVGLTAYGEQASWGVWRGVDAVLLPRAYSDMVVAAGGIPVLLPPLAAASDAVDRLDAVILSGGPDVGPERYCAAPHPRTGVPRPERDAAEIAVLHRALGRGIPVLGVCRGMQVLNVALGGTLTQHVPDVAGHDGHNPSPGVFGAVEVTLDPASRAGRAVGPSASVSCHHHQSLDVLGDGLVVTGRAADGTVEAVERAGGAFVVGVQWHPEQAASDARVFAALVVAAFSLRA
jgi:gamma-glutamyl-gamma-aminobutyrate hydrolase PuuD